MTTEEIRKFSVEAGPEELFRELVAQLAELNQFLRNCSNRPGSEPNQLCVVVRLDQP